MPTRDGRGAWRYGIDHPRGFIGGLVIGDSRNAGGRAEALDDGTLANA